MKDPAVSKTNKNLDVIVNGRLKTPEIKSSRYKFGKKLGEGSWGEVYELKDIILEENYAAKVWTPTILALKQMEERPTVTKNEVMKTEAIDPNTYRNIAQRKLEFDENGEPFIVMKKYDQFLSDYLRNGDGVRSYKNGTLSKEEAIKLTLDVVSATGDMHTKRKDSVTGRIKPKVHGDLKEDNIGIEIIGGIATAEPIDFGSSTTVELGIYSPKKGEKKNLGHLYTRAPEVFKFENAPRDEENIYSFFKNTTRPDERSEVYSTTNQLFKQFTGKYFLQDQLELSDNPEKMITEMKSSEFNKFRNKEIMKNIPFWDIKLKKIMKKGLSYYPHERYSNCTELEKDLRPVYDRLMDPATGWKDFKKWFKRLAIPVVALAGFGYLSSVHEPTDISLPNITKGQMLLPQAIPNEQIIFEKEDSTKYNPANVGVFTLGLNTFNTISDNPYVVHLVRMYRVAIDAAENRGSMNIPSEYQLDVYLANTLPEERRFQMDMKFAPIAKTIELSMNQNKTDEGTIDLEDVCVQTAAGPKKLNDARRISKSFDYQTYKNAKYRNGTYVLNNKERDFIDTWLSQINLTKYQFPSYLKDGSKSDSSQSESIANSL